MATRLPASQRTREELTALIEGRLQTRVVACRSMADNSKAPAWRKSSTATTI